MICAIPFDQHFYPQAKRLLEWCHFLCGRSRHACILTVSRDTPESTIAEATRLAQKAFCSVSVIKPGVADRHTSPETINLFFRTTASYSFKVTKQPFFWCGVDCVPLTIDWLDRLEAEYISAEKPYMGVRVVAPIPHLIRTAIYPTHVGHYNPNSLLDQRNKFGMVPFNLVDPARTLSQAHVTGLIQNERGTKDNLPTFPNKESLKLVSKQAVVFHQCQDGTLIDRLREVTKPTMVKKMKLAINGWSKLLSKMVRSLPNITLIYIHVPGDPKHQQYATKFVNSYINNPPCYDHKTIVVCQIRPPDDFIIKLFQSIPNTTYFRHDDSGHDIGGFLAASKTVKDDCVMCFGGSSYFKQKGWLRRMAMAWEKHGPGFYGVTGTYEVSPHLNTSGFMCSPALMNAYPIKVTTKPQRYDFEHGQNALWKAAAAEGFPVKLVTWDGEYGWQDWRKPKNIFRRGDQSNILCYWHHCDKFDNASLQMRTAMSRNTDNITDPAYLGDAGDKIEERSLLNFLNKHGFNES